MEWASTGGYNKLVSLESSISFLILGLRFTLVLSLHPMKKLLIPALLTALLASCEPKEEAELSCNPEPRPVYVLFTKNHVPLDTAIIHKTKYYWKENGVKMYFPQLPDTVNKSNDVLFIPPDGWDYNTQSTVYDSKPGLFRMTYAGKISANKSKWFYLEYPDNTTDSFMIDFTVQDCKFTYQKATYNNVDILPDELVYPMHVVFKIEK